MGINIEVVRIIKKEMEEGWGGHLNPYYVTETCTWFDTCRHSGDREFILDNQFFFIEQDLPFIERKYARPESFEECITWVENVGIPVGNKNRLLDALCRMKNDENMAFKWSW